MKVLVTGGAGKIGRATVEYLVQHGHDVRAIDTKAGITLNSAAYATCDILDYEALRQQMKGCDAVVHLAAIISAVVAPSPTLFQVNAAGTFNVFEAAAAEGIRRIAQASSINALGCAYNVTDMALAYLPVDEAHPSFTTDPYSFSKEVIESIGDYYWRRDGISSVALRFPWVYSRGYLDSEDYRKRVRDGRTTLDMLLSLPEVERHSKLEAAKAWALDFRRKRLMEFGVEDADALTKQMLNDPLLMMATLDRFNFWAFLDERDAAQSLVKGLTADYEGSHVLFINDTQNWLRYDTATLAALFFPEVHEWKTPPAGASTLLSNEKARQLIGYEPAYSVASVSVGM